MKTYKLKSLTYFICFIAAVLMYYGMNNKAEITAENEKAKLEEVAPQELTSVDFADKD